MARRKKIEPRCAVKVEVLDERYCGELTGRIVHHTSEASFALSDVRLHQTKSPIAVGCPLGRGYTASSSIADFCQRANADNPGLNLTPEQVLIVDIHNRVKATQGEVS